MTQKISVNEESFQQFLPPMKHAEQTRLQRA